jgi:adenosylcobinamide kinase/adenosylcobinamide-phosphate guanylyltransferase
MSLVLISGGARSGKSRAAQRLVGSRYEEAVVVVCAHSGDDHEMQRRIAHHQAARPEGFRVMEAHEDLAWIERVPQDACLLLDCFGTLVGQIIASAFAAAGETPRSDDLVAPETEDAAERSIEQLTSWLTARRADTVVVTNEVGAGVVPAYPDARLFRDVLGAANRRLADAADAAYLAIDGRLLDLKTLPYDAVWPDGE